MCNNPESDFDIEHRRNEIIKNMELIIMDLILSTVQSLQLRNQTLEEQRKWAAAEQLQF